MRPAPDDPAPFHRVHGRHVIFGAPRNVWILTRQQAALSNTTADPHALAMAIAHLRPHDSAPLQTDIVAALSARVAADLPLIRTVGEHSHAMSLSERTFRRRLADAGTTYSDVVDAVRENAAGRMLQQADLGLSEISSRLGYSDERSFRRATHRWFGHAPTESRRRVRAQ